ncbi:hypothetical protein SERLA73DRAFT_182387 [Serpula lacrymans var. lacrymans S7.3]|uniref:Uncharacterized protein n=2 Tax=Serpula lacrymans var. lacrymans TaxID=341189 RepID=F8PX36_SERL3|nr:uncharacterized protein SERLADRAFT_469009 [Serpula lacrymans var. lacrymans S7.9]EGN99415.1 hypothetical protein SERLA73DRAFT_182387 [Serpula lacrymans var. lacrymans S7.3]EGO24978.1 hypothetical protein SERLADRAFT_469009 [Serpula lacrymans var. lacrymans S7.9]
MFLTSYERKVLDDGGLISSRFGYEVSRGHRLPQAVAPSITAAKHATVFRGENEDGVL